MKISLRQCKLPVISTGVRLTLLLLLLFVAVGTHAAPVSVTSSAGTGGSIQPSGKFSVASGASQSFVVTAGTGYGISKVTVNGNSWGAVSAFTISNITVTTTVVASFVPYPTIKVTAGAGGFIDPSGVVTVVPKGSRSFSITPFVGYTIGDVNVNGKSVGPVLSYTFGNVTNTSTISASFKPFPVVMSSASKGGTISPLGTNSVAPGSAVTFQLTPQPGYAISNLLINGKGKGPVVSYTVTNVMSNLTAIATFGMVKSNLAITASASSGGSIFPAGIVSVFPGSNQTFNVSATANYSILDVKVNTKSVGPVSSYTFTNVRSSGNITASFKPYPKIVATAGSGGTISHAGTNFVAPGASLAFQIQTNAGYAIADLKVNGASKGAIASYQFANVTNSGTIAATFKLMPGEFTLTATASSGGTIVPPGPVAVAVGANQTFQIAAKTGYFIFDVKVNGKSVGAQTSWTFTNVSASAAISAVFKPQTVSLTASTLNPQGTITPAGTVAASYATNVSFAIKPKAGYKGAVKVDGAFAKADNTGKSFLLMLTNVTATHSIQAWFVKTNLPFAHSVSIALKTLGNTIAIANQTPVNVQGFAGADVGIMAVYYFNEATGDCAWATGAEDWNAEIALVQGDNPVRFVAIANDNTIEEIQRVITYYPTLDFTSPLTISQNVAYVGDSVAFRFGIGLADRTGALVEVFQTDASGQIQNQVTALHDDGVLPDEIQSDGVFTGDALSIIPSQTGDLFYRARVSKGGDFYYSEVEKVTVTKHLNSDQVQTAVSAADLAKAVFDSQIVSNSPLVAAQQALAQLKQDFPIGAADVETDGGIWWITQDGILGFFQPSVSGSLAGSPTRMPSARKLAHDHDPLHGFTVKYFNAHDLATLFPAYRAKHLSAHNVASQNEIKSKKAILISPFLDNPDDPDNSLHQNDAYYGSWPTIANHQGCGVYAAKEVLNNGTVSVTLDTFKGLLGDYGYIQFYTHGDNLYNGLFSLWEDAWGPSDFLRGSLSQVVIYTGIVLPTKLDGSIDTTGYEDDLVSKRIAISAGGSVVLLPSFFDHYLPQLPNSLVVLTSCRSEYNSSLANAFLAKGAGAVIGYSEYVQCTYALSTVSTIVTNMYAGATIEGAVTDAIAKHGAHDNGVPAYLGYLGADDLVFPEGDLQNGGFEDGALTPWTVEGDGRIITQLGANRPTEGQFMGIISTGLGYTTTDGSISQSFCTTPNDATLSFDWDMYSEEWLEWCDSQYQDSFQVWIYVEDPVTGNETAHQVLERHIDDLCCCVVPADVGFDQGGVYMTGWQTAQIDISQWAGQNLRVQFYATDIGDSIFDTAILLDNIHVNSAP